MCYSLETSMVIQLWDSIQSFRSISQIVFEIHNESELDLYTNVQKKLEKRKISLRSTVNKRFYNWNWLQESEIKTTQGKARCMVFIHRRFPVISLFRLFAIHNSITEPCLWNSRADFSGLRARSYDTASRKTRLTGVKVLIIKFRANFIILNLRLDSKSIALSQSL